VLEAGASCGPVSSGMPSGPGFSAPAADAVEVVALMVCVVAVELEELEAAAACDVVLLLLLLPHAASRHAPSSAATGERKRAGIAPANGSDPWARLS